uniref:C-type lectin domain-containing protein n=1 Tax=Erpetoichthys calabaricus TaxID=27687 RepID=A0A8C4XF84_ERPCA
MLCLELEELKIANYNLTSNNSALLAAHAILQFQYEINNSYLQESRDSLQSQYAALNKKHEELAQEFSKLQEYYCDGTNTSHENTCPLCKVGWIPFGSKCYFISTMTLTWNESRDWCLTKGGQLVNILSEDSFHLSSFTITDVIRRAVNPRLLFLLFWLQELLELPFVHYVYMNFWSCNGQNGHW